MSNELLRWRKEASSEEWKRLAALAKTSVGYLDQIAYGLLTTSATLTRTQNFTRCWRISLVRFNGAANG